ncbi:MAG: fructose-6-phosphate aldolase [candidate division WOR-3 bacterium]|uniref:Probable transaldolase n=1 Tax=candidate division WOR-3 bacterium TaxID=2052148 RepID=A0A7V4ABC7_UNCW3
MKIFVDTANIDEIKELVKLGIIDGATTNPTLLSKEIERQFKDFKSLKKEEIIQKSKEILREICEIVKGPVSAEVIGTKAGEMVEEGKELSKIHENIVVKIPFTSEGLKATKILSSEGVKVNMTLVFSPAQAILAAKVNAFYVSPFIGRLDDISHFGMDLVRMIVEIYENYGFETQVLVASCRHPLHVIESALAGAHIITVPPDVIKKLLNHPLTDIGLERFLADWKKVLEK